MAPGVTFDVDKPRGLSGICDYLLVQSREVFFIRGPVFAAVEAKKEDITGGLGQCAAEMVAIQIFNEKEKTTIPAVFGCVTSGNLWRFLKLEGSTLFIDKTRGLYFTLICPNSSASWSASRTDELLDCADSLVCFGWVVSSARNHSHFNPRVYTMRTPLRLALSAMLTCVPSVFQRSPKQKMHP